MDQIHDTFGKHLEYVYCQFFNKINKILTKESNFPQELFHKYLGMNPNVPTEYLLSIPDKDDLNYFISNKAFTENLFNFMKDHNYISDTRLSDVICQSWITCDFIIKNKIFISKNIVQNPNLSFDDLIYLKKKNYKYIHWNGIMEVFKISNEMVSKYPDFDWERYFMELYDNINIPNSFFDQERFHIYLERNYKCSLENTLVNRHQSFARESDKMVYLGIIADKMMLQMKKRMIERTEENEKDVPWDLIFEYPNFNFWKMDKIFENIPWYFDREKGKFYAHLKEFSLELNRFIDGMAKNWVNLVDKIDKNPLDTPKRCLQQIRMRVIANLIKNISFTDEQLADEFKKIHRCKKIVRQIEKSYLDPEYTCCINRLKREFLRLQNETT